MAITIYTEPVEQNTAGGWFSPTAPIVYIEDLAASAQGTAYYISLGTVSNPTAYATQTSGKAYTAPAEIYPTSLSGLVAYGSTAAPYVYYSATSPITSGSSKVRVSWTNIPPVYSAFEVRNNNLTTVTGAYLPASGFFRLAGLRGFSSAPGANQVYTKIRYIRLYCENTLLASGEFDTTQNNIVEQAVTFTMGNTTQVLTPSWGGDDPSHLGDTRFTYAILDIPFSTSELLLVGSNFYAEIETDGGVVLTTTTVIKALVFDKPVIDRLSVSEDEGGTATVLATVLHSAAVSGMEVLNGGRAPCGGASMRWSEMVTIDGESPAYIGPAASNTFVTGPYTGLSAAENTAMSNTGTSGCYRYKNSNLSVSEGTVKFWFKGTGWASTTNVHPLLGFSKTGSTTGTDVFEIVAQVNPALSSSWLVYLRVYDSFGNLHYAAHQLPILSGVPISEYTWVQASWKLNDAGGSMLSIKAMPQSTPSTANYFYSSSSGTIPFGVMPSVDIVSSATSGTVSQDNTYSDVYFTGSPYTVSTSGNAVIADVMFYDTCLTFDSSVPTYPVGWRNDLGTFSTTSRMFMYAPSVAANQTLSLRLRPVSCTGAKAKSSFFNTVASRPMILRGIYSGVTTASSGVVKRMRLIDASGEFPDYQFAVNPTTFTLTVPELVKSISSINGSVLVMSSPRPASGCDFSWDNTTRVVYLELKKRADSGNPFLFIDHNDEVYYGKLSIKGVDEIVATVPSRYKISVEFVGYGGGKDYSMYMYNRVQ